MASVPRIWPGETAALLACGPSLTKSDVEYVRGKARVIAINDSYKLAPWADVLYACDARWWRWHNGAKGFEGLKFSLQRDACQYKGVQILQNTGIEGLELKPTGLKNGRNSGYQAINLAVHFGVTRIVLLGYDMQRGPKCEEHWFGEHPNRSRSPYQAFQKRFHDLTEPLARLGVEVVNCSRDTALTMFRREALERVL